MPVIGNDPFGNIKSEKGSVNPSPEEVKAFHTRADTDSSTTSQHHTLGTRRNQASFGSHIHDGVDSKIIASGQGLILVGAKGGNVALANLIAMLSQYIEFTDLTT
jgi:hypothetical protein